MEFIDLTKQVLAEWASVADVVTFVIASYAAYFATLSYRLARSSYREAKADEVLALGPFVQPEDLSHTHARPVLAARLVNRSHRRCVVSSVEAIGKSGTPIPLKWSEAIDGFGNPLNPGQPIAIDMSQMLYLRRVDGEAFLDVEIRAHHSFENSPAIQHYSMEPGWDRWHET